MLDCPKVRLNGRSQAAGEAVFFVWTYDGQADYEPWTENAAGTSVTGTLLGG
ncbi:MAG: hypothetical protein PHQ83_03730 [Eubacteriales bacterium]|nr:hypothetical protein [Eubacteriales bacterium]